jgi:hypothetical protein
MRVWDRMNDWYGVRMSEAYGATPPRDWCRAVDHASDSQVRDALTKMRRAHTSHPPTLPEFEALLAPPRTSVAQGSPIVSRLADYAIKHLRLTPRQLAAPWTWLHKGEVGGHDYEITGVVILSDGEAPGHRVNLADLALAEAC